ncbi:serine/threonine-protein kinase [Halioxenophilus sp. WMMB6]|uniref:serine/threonine-protein kinase n=1 Tax=Halioxenophilus sp. WMMB6 TaxID=3073815 RepID=UPI00295E4008|nr:serine/threonine-protein kinase [Halioxenophilus sp. WMMB6]
MKNPLSSLFNLPIALFVVAILAVLYGPSIAPLQHLDRQLYLLAGGARSMQAGYGLTVPIWGELANIGLWMMGVCLWLWLLPRPGLLAAILIACISLAGYTGLQLYAQLQHQLWLPQGVLIQYLLISVPVVLIRAQQKRTWAALVGERDAALLELADIKLQAGQLDQAATHLQTCQPNPAVTELGYQLALQQEQRRAYQAATKTYQWLAGLDPKYKDVSEKANSVLSATVAINSDDLLATQTLNIPQEQQRQPRLGRYRIERELGRGAMGTVYLGVDPKIARRVAIKTLSYKNVAPHELEGVKQRFFREAEATGRLSHPNIVTVFDVGEEPDLCYMAMDFIEGDSLRVNSTEDNLLAVSTVYQLVAQVADALHYAHKKNIVHRDIKPGNLLYDEQHEQVKVADFGIARIVDSSSTKTGDILGSPLYMSPEQLKGQKVTGASDIYSLGVTLYQLLTGQAPYSSDSIANLAYQVINKKCKSVRELRPALPASAPRIVNKAMAKEPDKRYTSAGAMAEALRKALQKDFGIS